ncbi:MAG: nuclear transport factor 2 family protein [Candidatus Rhabdochlamydia oedothoracis]|nr:nuclear transport factor 2 family protein [Candidatus Rhabdochlamydia oedothoracis]
MVDTKAIAVAYYTALGNKDMEEVKKYLHPNIQFADPQEKVVGREAVLTAAKGFTAIFKALTVHAKFGSENQAMIVYDVDIPGLPKKLRAASLLSFQEGLISNIELVYDTRCLTDK